MKRHIRFFFSLLFSSISWNNANKRLIFSKKRNFCPTEWRYFTINNIFITSCTFLHSDKRNRLFLCFVSIWSFLLKLLKVPKVTKNWIRIIKSIFFRYILSNLSNLKLMHGARSISYFEIYLLMIRWRISIWDQHITL